MKNNFLFERIKKYAAIFTWKIVLANRRERGECCEVKWFCNGQKPILCLAENEELFAVVVFFGITFAEFLFAKKNFLF